MEPDSLRRILLRAGYRRTRAMLLAAGIALLTLLSVVMFARGIDTKEVLATLLFIPVFAAMFVYGLKGGLVAGIAAAAVYASLRSPAIALVGLDRFIGLIAYRSVSYLAFGVIGGWASEQVDASLAKLERHDRVDDLTGLGNARSFIEDCRFEMSRSDRYESIFSAVSFDLPYEALDGFDPRRRRSVIKSIARAIGSSVRTVDRPAHADDGERHLFAVVLPETPAEGAEVFRDRVVTRTAELLRERGIDIEPENLPNRRATYPGDHEKLNDVRSRFARVAEIEHPDGSEIRE